MRPGTRGDLLAVRQRKGKALRQYIQHFSQGRMAERISICNIGVGRTLVDGGAGLNLLSPEVFPRKQIGEPKLTLLPHSAA